MRFSSSAMHTITSFYANSIFQPSNCIAIIPALRSHDLYLELFPEIFCTLQSCFKADMTKFQNWWLCFWFSWAKNPFIQLTSALLRHFWQSKLAIFHSGSSMISKWWRWWLRTKVWVEQTDNTLGVMAWMLDLGIIITAIYRMMMQMMMVMKICSGCQSYDNHDDH